LFWFYPPVFHFGVAAGGWFGSGLVGLFQLFYTKIQTAYAFLTLFFFLAQTLFAQDVDDGGLARFARSARLPEEMENNLYLDSYSYSYPYLYLFEIYIRNKTMSVQLAVA